MNSLPKPDRAYTPVDGNFRVPRPATPLPFTGERMTSGTEGQIAFEHYHRYCVARDWCRGRDVLDVASGEGYGTAFLSEVAQSVIGVEIDPDSVAHAVTNYGSPNVRFLQGDAQRLPLSDQSFDVVVSFETLEHLRDHASFIAELRRVLRPTGLLVISTPDRAVYSAPGSDPNPFHFLELTGGEFIALLRDSFAHVEILSQRPVLGSLIASAGSARWRSYERRSQDFIEATSGMARAPYLIGVASNTALPEIGSSVYFDRRRVHDVVEEAANFVALRDCAHVEATRHAEAITQLNSRIEEAQRQIEAARDAVGRERNLRQTDVDLAAQEIARLQSRLRAESAGREAAIVAAEAARRSYDAIRYGTLWRLMAPIRVFAERFPGAARLLRRAAKLFWWSITLQLGRRIAPHLRQRAEKPALPAHAPQLPQQAEQPIADVPPAGHDYRRAFETLHGGKAIHFPPLESPDVSVVIPAYKGLADLENCLRSLAVTVDTEPRFEVILLDDCPAAPILWAIPDSGGLRKIANPENLGFLRTCNSGAAAARGRFLCFLNSDTIVSQGWLSSLVDALETSQGAVLAGGMMLNRDGTIQEAGWRILANGWGYPIGRNENQNDGAYTYRRPVDCVSGACFVIRRDVFEALDGFDDAYAPAFYEEFDLAFRARARGFRAIYEPGSRVVHLGSASYGAARRDELSVLHHAIFVERFAEYLRRQPWDTSDPFALRHGPETGPLILVADYGVPQPDRHAGDVTMSRYLALFAVAGWRVVFAPMNGIAEGPAAAALERQGIELIRRPNTVQQWLARHGRHVDEVWLARPEIATALIEPVRTCTTARIAYYPHDLHYVRQQREAVLRGNSELAAEAALTKALEISVLQRVDVITTPSDEEAETIRSLVPGQAVQVLPPFFYEDDEILSRQQQHFGKLLDIVFVGGFPHAPNVDAAIFIVSEVMPLIWEARPQARLVLVGYAPPPEIRALAGSRVVVTGQVPDVRPFLDQARLVLTAMRFGAGVKGKVVDALRLGVPVVTTPVGAEGIGIEPGREALIADDPVGLARHALTLFDSTETCAALSVAGAALIRRRFSRAAARGAVADVFQTPHCSICGSRAVQAPSEGNFREATVCRNCGALARTDALGRVMLSALAGEAERSLAEWARRRPRVKIHEFGFVGGIAEVLRSEDWFTVSEYFDDVPAGSAGCGGIRCEDLTRLTFDDSSFDMVISQDVMEHVPDPASAFAETARVLRPGGRHIFTVPVDRRLGASVTRARLSGGRVEHLLAPEYHGDPIRAEGALVFTDFGRDLGKILQRAGLNLIEHEMTVPGCGGDKKLWIYEGVKPTRCAEQPASPAV